MSNKKLNESFLSALSASKKKRGPRISSEALSALGVKRESLQDKEDISDLKALFPKGSTAFLVLRNVASSGMSRQIGVIAFRRDGKDLIDWHPNYKVAKVLGYKVNKDGNGIKVSGAGMDMGFQLISSLARKLYGDDYAIKHRWL